MCKAVHEAEPKEVKMIELGKVQCLNVVNRTDFGVYLALRMRKYYFQRRKCQKI